jgi:hypothetical protein
VPNCRNERPKVWTNVPKCRGRTSQSADIAKDIVPEIHQPGVVSGVGSCVHSYEVNRGGERGGEQPPSVNQGVSELWIRSESVDWKGDERPHSAIGNILVKETGAGDRMAWVN